MANGKNEARRVRVYKVSAVVDGSRDALYQLARPTQLWDTLI